MPVLRRETIDGNIGRSTVSYIYSYYVHKYRVLGQSDPTDGCRNGSSQSASQFMTRAKDGSLLAAGIRDVLGNLLGMGLFSYLQ